MPRTEVGMGKLIAGGSLVGITVSTRVQEWQQCEVESYLDTFLFLFAYPTCTLPAYVIGARTRICTRYPLNS